MGRIKVRVKWVGGGRRCHESGSWLSCRNTWLHFAMSSRQGWSTSTGRWAGRQNQVTVIKSFELVHEFRNF